MKFAKDHPWLHERVVRLVGRKQLEKVEEQAAAYWEQAIDGIDQAQLTKALVRLFGKKEGKRLLRLGRSEKVKRMAGAEADALVRRLREKIAVVVAGPGDRLESSGLRLEEHPYSEAKTLHEGVEYYHKVDGLLCFTGVVTVHHEDGGTSVVNVFSRWVSHPFWQYSYVASGVVTKTAAPAPD
jgi:hypothetical protein